MLMTTPIFVLGSIAFYLLLLAFTAAFFYCTENDDQPGWTVFGVVMFVLAWSLFGDLLPSLRENPLWAVIDIAIWVAIGMLWSFPRWFLFLRRVLADYNKAHAEYLAGSTQDYDDKGHITKPNTEAGWASNGSYNFVHNYGMSWVDGKIQPPTFAANRKRLVAWVAIWPWSLVWTFAREVVVKGLQHLVNLFGGTYQRISNWVFSGIK